MMSWLPFEWIAAVRFLREGAAQTFLIVIGAAVGVAVIIFMTVLLAGVQGNMISRVLSAQAHIVLTPLEDVARSLREGTTTLEAATVQKPPQRLRSIDQWQSIRDRMRGFPGVATVAPIVSGSAFAIRGDASKAISLIGVEPENYFKIVDVPGKIVTGAPTISSESVIIGIQLASDLGVGIGDKLRVSTASGRDDTLTISGIFDLGNKGVNQRTVFIALRNAQSLLGVVGGVTSLELTVTDIYAAETIAQDIQATTAIAANSWIKTMADFFTAFNTMAVSNRTIRVFVGITVALGIASVLVVSVVQRAKDIGILRAMGSSRGQIMRLFLLQGALVGLAGSIVGSLLAIGSLFAWDVFARNSDGSSMFPLNFDPYLFGTAAIVAVITGVVAAILPAARAARLDPVVAIRG
jgi:lipoprotein-releasing system permease protein